MSALLTNMLRSAFNQHGFDDLSTANVALSDRPDLADFSSVSAFRAAKSVGVSPNAVAKRLVEESPWPDGVEAFATGGFINFKVDSTFLAREVLSSPAHYTDPNPRKIMIDFGGPNIAKSMHVGHLRSLVIGDALTNLLRVVGHEVVTDIHLGDWGFQMGLLLAFTGGLPDDCLTVDVLEGIYPTASALAKSNEYVADAARSNVHKLHVGNSIARTRWKIIRENTLKEVSRDLDTLGITFDLWEGESDAKDHVYLTRGIYTGQGLLVEDDGAEMIPLEGMPPLMFMTTQGGALYGATDLATIFRREEKYCPDEILYVVDERQNLHFKQVFAAHGLFDNSGRTTLKHVGFGTINGPDGKPLKTREGTAPKLRDLMDSVLEKARSITFNSIKDPEEAEATSRKVAIAALKFGEFLNHRQTSYVFNLDQMLSFEGKTGPYVLYQMVRMAACLQKANVAPGPLVFRTPHERAIGLLLTREEEVFVNAVTDLNLTPIAEYAYALADAFSSFYRASWHDGERIVDNSSHVTMVSILRAKLGMLLQILGIDVPERM